MTFFIYKFAAFFWAILYILSQLGKKYAYFLQIVGKICTSPPFFIPFQSFFFPNMLFGHIFAPPPTLKHSVGIYVIGFEYF